jgi:hypothetical protein
MTKPTISLNLTEKLEAEEQTELQRRLLALMEQMYLEGISTGRELSREDLHAETEKYITQKMAFLTNYFMEEKVWEQNPPAGYDPKRDIPTLEIPENDSPANNDMVAPGENLPDPNKEVGDDREPEPEWAKKDRPFG